MIIISKKLTKIAGVGYKWLQNLGFEEEKAIQISSFLNNEELFESQKSAAFVKNILSKINDKNISLNQIEELSAPYQKTIAAKEANERANLITKVPQYQKWVKGLINLNLLNPNKEDDLKLSMNIKKFHEISQRTPKEQKRNITEFKSDNELFEYVSKFDKKTSELDKKRINGAKLIDSTDDVKLYHLTTQEAINEFGKNANWCVVTKNGGVTYSPHEYYCFVVDGVPVALAHPQSDQIKDKNDSYMSNIRIIDKIYDIAVRHKLHKPDSHAEDYNELEEYKKLSNAIKDNLDDETMIRYWIAKDYKVFDVLPNDIAVKHALFFAKTHALLLFPDELSLEKWEIAIQSMKINNIPIDDIRKRFIAHFTNHAIGRLNIGTFNNQIPKNLGISLSDIDERFYELSYTELGEGLNKMSQKMLDYRLNEIFKSNQEKFLLMMVEKETGLAKDTLEAAIRISEQYGKQEQFKSNLSKKFSDKFLIEQTRTSEMTINKDYFEKEKPDNLDLTYEQFLENNKNFFIQHLLPQLAFKSWGKKDVDQAVKKHAPLGINITYEDIVGYIKNESSPMLKIGYLPDDQPIEEISDVVDEFIEEEFEKGAPFLNANTVMISIPKWEITIEKLNQLVNAGDPIRRRKAEMGLLELRLSFIRALAKSVKKLGDVVTQDKIKELDMPKNLNINYESIIEEIIRTELGTFPNVKAHPSKLIEFMRRFPDVQYNQKFVNKTIDDLADFVANDIAQPSRFQSDNEIYNVQLILNKLTSQENYMDSQEFKNLVQIKIPSKFKAIFAPQFFRTLEQGTLQYKDIFDKESLIKMAMDGFLNDNQSSLHDKQWIYDNHIKSSSVINEELKNYYFQKLEEGSQPDNINLNEEDTNKNAMASYFISNIIYKF